MEQENKSTLLTDVEQMLKDRFVAAPMPAIPSNAAPAKRGERVQELVLPDAERGRMPFTKDKFLVKENPHLVEWERETRKFLRKLSPDHGHRVSAIMVYEWATGINVQELMNGGGNPRPDLMKINQVLRFYFGKPYMTHIMGRKVPNCYKVRPGYLIRRHRPLTLTLYAEYCEGALNP